MQLPRSTPPRASRRLAAALAGAVLLAGSVAGCGEAHRLTTAMEVRDAFAELGTTSTATVTATVHGSTHRAYEFLRRAHGAPVSRADARRLVRAELTLSAGSGHTGEPLRDVPRQDAVKVAAALNFGGGDVIAAKSVQDRLYLRTDLNALVRQAGATEKARRAAARITGLAGELPLSLGSARDALHGSWVWADPADFDDFLHTAETLSRRAAQQAREQRERQARTVHATKPKPHHGHRSKHPRKQHRPASLSAQQARRIAADLRAQRTQRQRSQAFHDAARIGAALNGQSQREFLAKAQQLLRHHAQFTDEGSRDGAHRVRLTLPGRTSAEDLAGALRPLGADVDPRRVPDRDIDAQLTIRRGQLCTLTLDLSQFTGGPRLTLRLDFAAGGAISVAAPGGAKELRPQDLMATVAYGALGSDRF